MSLTLSVHTYRDAAPSQPLFRRFDRLGGALGRSAGNELVLDDPGKYISRVHARIEFRDGAYCLVDVGSNPSLVNERPVGPGRHVALADGDRITIGDYQLVASVVTEAVPTLPPSPLQDITAAAPSAPALPANPDDSLAGAGILDVGGDPLNPSFDPLGLNLFGSAPTPAPIEPAWRGAESDHVPPELAPFPAAALPSAPVAPPPPPAAATGPMAIPDDYDPLADFLPPRVQATPAPTPAPTMPPPPPTPAPVEATAIAPPAPPRSSNAADDPVIAALMRGLGLEELNTRRSAEEIAELAGSMLREATAGTMGVLMGRAMTKRESRLDMTMISSQANNPLKFFPDADSALTQMVNGSMPGYMPAPRAFANAFDDLKAHELAIMAGMRAALAGVLKRFDPAAIEARLDVPSVMDKMLSSNRKAKMWDRMVELYTEMAREADSDFHRLFGEAFAVAYEEQVQLLRQARR
ncbi:type VI secretion system-associated FHA domain protein TagH [Massilia sp. IC2-476]|uniref:type VI secretion system-associated FHA domain protein TagH n=1 Tax=Massilia sp. IC2-476 TaxID=2887199 RepID=UPI001D10DB95|nr:type VI secretion system-associated FHA domain protein TagH [Massilia sp. IC2-476]MCC2974187.1 type VI secretion system-associated FHA domain protein TagH [Massilia sp. IC2-476]